MFSTQQNCTKRKVVTSVNEASKVRLSDSAGTVGWIISSISVASLSTLEGIDLGSG